MLLCHHKSKLNVEPGKLTLNAQDPLEKTLTLTYAKYQIVHLLCFPVKAKSINVGNTSLQCLFLSATCSEHEEHCHL